MCFAFLPACFGAISSSTRHIDWGGDCKAVMHRECFRLGFLCKVSASQGDHGSFPEGARVPRKLRDGRSGRPPRQNMASLGDGVSFRGGPSSDRVEQIVIRRRGAGNLAPPRNRWRDRVMIKLNFCFFFCRGWWAFLFLQLHMLQALAQDDVAPYFKTEPGLPQTHLEGNRLVLTCLAEGSWPLEYKWLHNGRETTAFTNEYTYVIPSLQRSDAGFYQCVVRNRMGALLQRKSEVQVAYMGNFQDADQRKTVSQGQATVLNFPHITSYPRPQVTWFRDGHKIIPSSRITTTLENQLVILATSAADAGCYYVQAVNEKNGENKTSPFIYLSVTGPDILSPTAAPVIVIPPRNTSVVAGSNEAILECVANGRPTEKLSIAWKRNGIKITSGVSSFGRRLAIANPTSADIGMYVCEAHLRGIAAAEPVRAKAFLSILESPYFTTEPKSRILAEVEKTVYIQCQAMGVPLPVLVWYKDAVPIHKLLNPRYKVLLNGSLQIQGLQPDDSGIYQCFARNDAGEMQSRTFLAVTNIAPTFSRLPTDTTVTEGMTAVLRCDVSGAPKPAIAWKRGNQVLASGSIQIPRFLLLESGGLQIAPVFAGDAGDYTCCAVNSEGFLNASAALTVWNRTLIVRPPEDSTVIKGTTAMLHCEAAHDPRISIRYVWKKDNVVINPSSSSRITMEKDGTLTISQTWSGDIGDYTCEVTSSGGNDSRVARLEVIELPHPPQNLLATLNSSFSRSVVLSWVRPFNGNSPVLHYIVELSENNSPWKVHLSDIDPKMTSITVSGLTPARTYQFRVCAVNRVGKGQYSIETSRLMLPEEPPSASPKNIVASGRTNQSIMVQWQPPPESEHNGVLHGYILRYRLAGLPGEYQYKNITSAEINYCLIKDLIIWTQYEIQVASYNGAGLGAFSRAVTEYTLQGVPTAPPQNIQAEAVNSTTIQFFWNPPPQQFINGINQGYKLLAWPIDAPETVTAVTITPDFHGVHSGYITNLKKFTAYYTSVLCFTTPGDGPRSSPQLLKTHEDRPGAVGHLSFTEILDTSLKVSWQEPVEKNGIITGYQISWEVYSRNESRLARTLANTTLEYKITGLSSLTTYTIEVAAETSKGTGMVTSSTISSGVPPELPGAPSNLVISNISPRSATLQFRPGYDGKTSISKWIVEGQVGVIGEEEEWITLCEVEKESDAQMLEIPNLTPYTHYRFRMRQVNVVGQSPLSQPSRVIQTLQAPPDVAPGSVTVRTASETSLWVRWVPLPDSQYNGNPESVGYRIKYWCVDVQPLILTKVINDRLEREHTIEDLEEWTEYELQIQAFNAIGAGPWSEVMRGRTRESVPSAPPENVSAEAVSSTQILLTWAAVPEPEQNGLILGYKILFKPKDVESKLSSQVVRGNHTLSILLAGLRKYVLYEIQVLAFTRIGDGIPSSPPVIERTKDDAPGSPVRMVFPEVKLTSVRIVWQPPEEPNGIILGYQIAYRLATSSPNKFTTVEVGSTVRQFVATDLLPESAYIFRASAKTRQGWGEPLEATVITTEKRERPAPPRELKVPQSEVTSRSLQLHWVPGSDGSSPVRYFTVQIKELPGGEWQTYSSSISHEATSCLIDRLNPFTSYKLRLKATNDIGDSDFGAETEAVTTLQDVPGEPPNSVSVTPHTTSSVLVQWKPPNAESLNGLLLGYRIYYRELEYESTVPGLESKVIKNPSALRAELTELKKYKRYEVVVTAYNIVGESPASTPVEVFVGEAAPAMPPQNIQISALSASQLEVAWDPPPVDSQNGNIQGYKVYYWQEGSQNDTEKVKVLFHPETSIRLKNLTSYSKYLISISAFNAAGDGPKSSPGQGRTHQAAPSVPSFLAFSEITCSTLNVSWGEPAAANGLLQGYRVIYEPLAPVQGVSKVVTVGINGNWQRWLKVRDLTKGMTYLFRVQAKTITYGPELQANITAGPAEGSPGSPQHVLVSKTASGLTLYWTEGVPGSRPTTGYIIETRPSDEGLWDLFVKDIPRGATSYTVGLDKLKQGVSYEFRVVAVNEFGYGEPSAPSTAVSAHTESPFYEEWWFLLVMALCSIILILMVVFALILHGQTKKYQNCNTEPGQELCLRSFCRRLSPGKSISNVEESVTLDNGGFTALELNSRHLNVKNTFSKKNGTRSPPRPSPGGLHYSDEDICNKYNGAVLTESVALSEKPLDASESEATDSDYEDELPKHSFVNHYMSDPTYYNSWKRQPKTTKHPAPYRYEECVASEAEPYFQTVITTQSSGGVYTPTGQPAPGSRTPVTGFSSFV
ncbi:protein sidekick-1 isoform X3 [Zootoca vivipara]|uniref:protein sidekick-1 isoform X3 n=1 Tax=Zootoca vivipara TaxID=8524 RepID=UPI00293BB7B6|nr:protein sidekick-1 isoform X3 [Zootoca vivipara]